MTSTQTCTLAPISMYSPFQVFLDKAKSKPDLYERILRVFQGKESDFAGWREIVVRILPFEEVLAIKFTNTPSFYTSILYDYLGDFSLFKVLNAMNSLGLKEVCREICLATGNQFYIDCLKPQWFYYYSRDTDHEGAY